MFSTTAFAAETPPDVQALLAKTTLRQRRPKEHAAEYRRRMAEKSPSRLKAATCESSPCRSSSFHPNVVTPCVHGKARLL